jgi:hypothetical protein
MTGRVCSYSNNTVDAAVDSFTNYSSSYGFNADPSRRAV